MINGQKEIWISTGNKATRGNAIIAVSNCGRIMRQDGKIETASFGLYVSVGEKRSRMRLYRFLANTFIVKSEDDILHHRNMIDHITHTPDCMYINDVRNLRWCTHRENCNFPEAKANKSAANKGKSPWIKGKKHSEDAKARISAANKGNTKSKGLHWYTNGVVNKFTKECPPGFTRGKLQRKRAAK